MTPISVYLAALLIGMVAGLRVFTPLAAVAWATHLGAISLEGSRLAFFGDRVVMWVLTVMFVVELFTDQRPSGASRTMPVQFAARLASGALCGAAVAATAGSWRFGVLFGLIGAVLGTIGGHDARARLARAFHRDRPAAFLEDAFAIGCVALAIAGVA